MKMLKEKVGKVDKQKTVYKKTDTISMLFLSGIIILLSYHMFSYFLRLVFVSGRAADEFMAVMNMVRHGQAPFGTWTYIPIAIIVKIVGIFLSEVEIYKGFILAAILINILVIWLFYLLIVRIFHGKLSRFTLFLISVGCYLGMPGYCFLYGGNLKCSIWMIVFFCMLLISYQHIAMYMCMHRGTASARILKWLEVVLSVLLSLFLCLRFGGDFVYFVPVIFATVVEVYWNGESDKFPSGVYLLVSLVEMVIILVTGTEQMGQAMQTGLESFYWCATWIIVAQCICIAKEKRHMVELGAYGGLILILLLLQIFGVDERIRENHRELVQDEEIFAEDYFEIYGINRDFLQTNYTADSDIFFGSAEFIDLAEQAMTYSADEILLLADEITTTDKTWFTAITDRASIQMDGLNSTDEDISAVLKEQNPKYAVLFTNSRIYMAHYAFVSEYPKVYENSRGVILERPAEGW